MDIPSASSLFPSRAPSVSKPQTNVSSKPSSFSYDVAAKQHKPLYQHQPHRFGTHGIGIQSMGERHHLPFAPSPFLCAPTLSSEVLRPQSLTCCNKEFSSPLMLQVHRNNHMKCPMPGCSLQADSSLIDFHLNTQHTSRFEGRLVFSDKPEDVAKWIEARKRNFPTAARVQENNELLEEYKRRGCFVKKSRPCPQATSGREGRKRRRGHAFKSEARGSESGTLESLKQQLSSELGVAYERETWDVLNSVLPDEALRDCGLPDEDEDEESQEEEEDDGPSGSLNMLSSAYAASSEDEEDKEQEEEKMSTEEDEPTEKVIPEARLILEKESLADEQGEKLNFHLGPSSRCLRRRYRFDDKNPVFHVAQKRRSALHSRSTKFKMSRPTLLEMMLAEEIRHERNVLLQCVRYIVENKFFGVENCK